VPTGTGRYSYFALTRQLSDIKWVARTSDLIDRDALLRWGDESQRSAAICSIAYDVRAVGASVDHTSIIRMLQALAMPRSGKKCC
jgi:hypothetical protein